MKLGDLLKKKIKGGDGCCSFWQTAGVYFRKTNVNAAFYSKKVLLVLLYLIRPAVLIGSPTTLGFIPKLKMDGTLEHRINLGRRLSKSAVCSNASDVERHCPSYLPYT